MITEEELFSNLLERRIYRIVIYDNVVVSWVTYDDAIDCFFNNYKNVAFLDNIKLQKYSKNGWVSIFIIPLPTI